MNRNTLLRSALAVAVAAGLMVFGAVAALAANPGNPASLPTKVTVEILKPLTLAERTNLAFGKIVGPIGASASNTYTVAPTGGISVTGTGGGSAVSGSHAGSYVVTGSGGNAVDFAGSPGGCSDAALTLNSVTPSVASATLGATSGAAGFGLGGSLTIVNPATGSPPVGAFSCAYTVSAKYQ